MNRIDIILEKEQTNTSKIFIYMLNGRVMAFGYSAYYTALLCPKVIANWSHTDASGSFVCICIPDEYLRLLSQKYPTLADDECIRITPPLNICRQRDYFGEWQEQQLHSIPKIDIE